ncbi:MAG: hypothetical protein HXL21_04540 [Peptostreptococcus sp.]|uniref:hypothetical protein n=1 Tax=Peptostreptococcus sp. TaxID=1262 RepID=UPI001CAAA394|nr:hypothetical protein [Peptostreptococcus sp.]MBF1044635.1 hypothetical protein [Peptostreptococcus sp.]
MKKSEYKEQLFQLLRENIDDMNFSEKMNFVSNIIIDFEKENENQRDISNKGKSWTDEELKIILTDAPSKYNCLKYAKIFKRGYGSIEQIYKWAMTTNKEVQEKRGNDTFIKQIKKVAKEIGLRG